MPAAAPSLAGFFDPPQPLLCLIFGFAVFALVYGIGLARRRRRTDFWPALAYLSGLASLALFTQTWLDELGRSLFAAHRLQHLVLHHLGPLLIALAGPGPVLAAGLPAGAGHRLARLANRATLRRAYEWLQHPVIGGVVFVGLIALWLTPAVHGLAMASPAGYWLMNLGMAADGLVFWWFMLDPRPPGATRTTYGIGLRIAVLWAIMPPQIAIGAYITLTEQRLYPGYAAAERAWGLSAAADQQLGGLLTWIPPAMMSVLATLILIGYGFAHQRRARRDRSGAATRHAGPDRAENPTSTGSHQA